MTNELEQDIMGDIGAQDVTDVAPISSPQKSLYWGSSSICEYENICNTSINPNTTFIDQNTGKKLCSKHIKACSNCSNQHSIANLTETTNLNTDHEWLCRDCYFKLTTGCPNCGLRVMIGGILNPGSGNRYFMKEGGCTKCSYKCEWCSTIVDNDETRSHDGNKYCDSCFDDNFSLCSDCGNTIDNESALYAEDAGSLCATCYKDTYTECKKCNKIIEKNSSTEIEEDYYCESCSNDILPFEYENYTENFTQFTYTKKDKYIYALMKLAPISVKDLKRTHPAIADGLGELIKFSKGKLLTPEIIQEYRNLLAPEEFPVDYTTWTGIQRSITNVNDNHSRQLVINILPSTQMLAKLQANPIIYDMFKEISRLSKNSGHPYVENQIGWIRVELNHGGNYILVDEIQSDHTNVSRDHAPITLEKYNLGDYNLGDEDIGKLLLEYKKILKDFPNIAAQAASNFAKQNKFKTIYWHTYESGRALKNNNPPESIYSTIPKNNLFEISKDRPFGLDGVFFEKSAKTNQLLYKLARRLYIKYINCHHHKTALY